MGDALTFNILLFCICEAVPLKQGPPTWCPRQVAHKDHVGRPRACSKNNISIINVFTLMNINIKTMESKLSKIFISEVCIKLL